MSGPDPELTELLAASEQHLVRDMIAGREEAWRTFNTRYSKMLCQRITRVIGRSSSDDDIREVFAMLLMQLIANDMHRLRVFDPERRTRFSSWVALLATHCAHDYVRLTQRERETAPLSEAEAIPCGLPSPLDHIETMDRAKMLASVLNDFPAKDREFVSLYFGEELAPEQIAERMHISVKTVYSKKHKIQSRIEAMLSEPKLAA